jgi:hypothetical protein
MSFGPRGTGAINQDTFNGSAPNTIAPAPVKIIIPGAPKNGPPKPGSAQGAGIDFDTYHE